MKIFFLLFFFLSQILGATEVRILFSSSLNGNLDGCNCKARPISGMVKRGSWIEEYRKKYPDVILVDTGDSLIDKNDLKKAKAIYESFSLLKYDAYLVGETDLAIGISNFFEYTKNLKLVGTNFMYNPGFLKRNQSFGSTEIILNKNQLNIRILGYLNEDVLLYTSENIKSKIKYLKEGRLPRSNSNLNLTLALSHAGYDKDMKWVSDIDFPLIVIGGHDQYQPKEGAGFEVYGGIWYFQSGADGNQIGEIVLDVKQNGSFKVISHKLHTIDTITTPDHRQIRDLIIHLREAGTQ